MMMKAAAAAAVLRHHCSGWAVAVALWAVVPSTEWYGQAKNSKGRNCHIVILL